MEYERKFWINSYLPKGNPWPKSKKRKVISEESYPIIKKMISDGKSIKEIAISMGCSRATVNKAKKVL